MTFKKNLCKKNVRHWFTLRQLIILQNVFGVNYEQTKTTTKNIYGKNINF